MRVAQGASMSSVSDCSLPWWDREVDATGKPLRVDVRNAACKLWNDACQQTQYLLGEPYDATELMERSVAQVSRYLDRRAIPLFNQDLSALLMCAFCRSLRKYFAKLHRFQLTANVAELSAAATALSWPSNQDCRLDAERAIGQFSEKAREMYELRRAGFDWNEVAAQLSISSTAARAKFSRELRRVRLKYIRSSNSV